jgi:hypothetical protein
MDPVSLRDESGNEYTLQMTRPQYWRNLKVKVKSEKSKSKTSGQNSEK